MNGIFARDSILAQLICAAACVNDRFRRRKAAPATEHLQRFLSCVRTQHKKRIHSVGSQEPLAAEGTNVGSM
ncbi:hypothetical protein [Thalassobacter stenotrophicus]|uniref:hypothetical protein n=1 Tax=Thalassobacter stenotrophicus TaxID=266809 RepID=UPI000D5DC6D2|nr:hypothetical protein [Thalassobacter stenotrophicus]PVZ48329.1 hypothetical protein DD557_06015 [Thalassobacter stenotrophicus]